MSTNPVDLAREVLDAEKVLDNTPGILYLDGPTHEHEEAASTILNAAPDLARAVLAVAALAEKHETTARNMGPDSWGGAIAAKIAQEIHDSLNGDPA